jgi:hypothetical protein
MPVSILKDAISCRYYRAENFGPKKCPSGYLQAFGIATFFEEVATNDTQNRPEQPIHTYTAAGASASAGTSARLTVKVAP